MSDGLDAASKVVWDGRPWLTPALAGLTVEAVALAFVLSWVEFATGTALKAIGSAPLLLVTYGLVFLLWIGGAVRLAVVRATSHYVLRGPASRSSMGYSAGGSSPCLRLASQTSRS
jgi:hypothetical protein